MPDLRLTSQAQNVTTLWLVANYTVWWQRHKGVSSLLKANRRSTVPILLLSKNSRTFHDIQNVFPGCSALHMSYWTYCKWHHSRPTHLTKYTVHKHAIFKMYYIWNAKYFIIYCHFVSVSNSPNLAPRTLVNLNHNYITRLSRTLHFNFQDQSHFPDLGTLDVCIRWQWWNTMITHRTAGRSVFTLTLCWWRLTHSRQLL